MTPSQPPPVAADLVATTSAGTSALLEGIGLGEHDKAAHRAYTLFLRIDRKQQAAVATELVTLAMATQDHEQQLIACSMLEAIDRLDPTLVDIESIERLAAADGFSLRSSAAVLLWQHAQSAPGTVPISLLGALARPGAEDWYVQAPAMAAAKQLMLHRADARLIFDGLVASDEVEDRYAAAAGLLEITTINRAVVPLDLANRLARDIDNAVSLKGAELVRALDGMDERARSKHFAAFAM